MHHIQQNEKLLFSQLSELPRAHSAPSALSTPRFSKSSPALLPKRSPASIQFSSSHGSLFPVPKNSANGEDDNENIPVLSAVDVDKDDDDDVNGSAGAM